MKKIIKNSICPECGKKQSGFFVNPMCFCGHQSRKLNGWEQRLLNNFQISEEEFSLLTTQEKRSFFREAEWHWVDIKSNLIFSMCPFCALFVIVGSDTFSDIWKLRLSAIASTAFILAEGRIVIKSIYFDYQGIKDKFYFKKQNSNRM